MFYTFYIHELYMFCQLYMYCTYVMHVLHMFWTCSAPPRLKMQIFSTASTESADFQHHLDWKCRFSAPHRLKLRSLDTLFGHVPDMFQKSLEGQKWSFPKKFWGPLGYILASSVVSKSRSKIQKSWPKIKQIKCFSEAPESYLNSFALIIKFRARFSHRFMHFFIFHIFHIFPYISPS